MAAIAMAVSSCKKDESKPAPVDPDLPTVTTTAVTVITINSATSGGRVTSEGVDSVTSRGICWSTSQNPTIADTKTINASDTGSFTANLTALTPNTTYYVRAYATNIAGTAYGNQQTFTTLSNTSTTVTDADGNVYHSITIGTQVWLVENLKTSKYNDGTSIPNVTAEASWETLTTGAYCYYDNNSANNTNYGKLYNWFAIGSGKLAPAGWHIPTQSEWNTLITYLGGSTVAGGKLKATTLWAAPNTGATNSSGFTAFPSGARLDDGVFDGDLSYGNTFWASTETPNPLGAFFYQLSNTDTKVFTNGRLKQSGCSVRCIKN